MKRTRANRNVTVPEKSILTNDPSMTAWGWAVLDWNGNIVDVGCIKTDSQHKKQRIRKGDDTVRRVAEINQQLLKVIKEYNVNYILSELPHGSQNASAATMIGIVIGIMQTISNSKELGIEWYGENDSKKAVLGKQSATKQEMVDAISKLFPEMRWTGKKYKDEAIADAMAVYYVAKQQSAALKLFKHG